MAPGAGAPKEAGVKPFFASSLLHDNRRPEHSETLASALFNLRALEKGSESGEEWREREAQNPKQAPGSELSAQSPARDSNS